MLARPNGKARADIHISFIAYLTPIKSTRQTSDVGTIKFHMNRYVAQGASSAKGKNAYL